MRRFVIGMIVAAVAACAAAAGTEVSIAGQTRQDTGSEGMPDVTYTVDVNYVEVDAVVTDDAGRAVTGLTAGDFELYEDGKRQDISTVSFVCTSSYPRCE